MGLRDFLVLAQNNLLYVEARYSAFQPFSQLDHRHVIHDESQSARVDFNLENRSKTQLRLRRIHLGEAKGINGS